MRLLTSLVMLSVTAAAVRGQKDPKPIPSPRVRLLAPLATDDPPTELPPADDAPKKQPPAAPSPPAPPSPAPATTAALRMDLGTKVDESDRLCFDCFNLCDLPARWSVRADLGDGVGYTRGFTYVEGFVPFYQPDDGSVIFGDGRVVNFDDQNRWEFNAGAGYRKHLETGDVVLGGNLFYDGRHTDTHFYHQIGIGGEALFDRWEVRCNGYFIVGTADKLVAESEAVSLAGNMLILEKLQTREVAMGGLDLEVGAFLPVLQQFSPRVFVGYYHYSAEHMPTVNGVRGRFEAWLTPNVSLHCAIQNDRVFDTTVSGGVAIHFGGSRVWPEGPRTVEERLGQRVVRDVDVVIAQRTDRLMEPFEVFQGPSLGNVGGAGGSSPPGSGSGATPPPDAGKSPAPPPNTGKPPCPPPPPCKCLPFPGRPGDPMTFPGHHYPPGFHHDCFPGRGRYKHDCDDPHHPDHGHHKHFCDDPHYCRLLPRIHECSKKHKDHDG